MTQENWQGINVKGGHPTIQDNTIIFYPPKPPIIQRPSFDRLVKGLSRKYAFLEQLPPQIADEVWKMLRSASPQEFGLFELQVFRLVFNYCCYYSNHRLVPSKDYREFRKLTIITERESYLRKEI